MTEKQVETTICKYAKSLGAHPLKLSGPNDRGIPDRLFLYGGRVLFIEMKRPGKEPTMLQYKRLRELRDMGFDATWTDDIQHGKDLIEDFISDIVELDD